MNNEFVKRHSDVLMLLIMTEEKFTFLPEFLKMFDVETFFKFLELFAGVTFNVPSKEKLTKMFRDVHIWAQLSEKGAASASELAAQYNLDKNSVYNIKVAIDDMLEKKKSELRKIHTPF